MSPFKKGVLSLLILVLSALPSQGNEVMFSPVIRNFTPSDYHGGRQNWSVSQSASGLIYVGNNQYLLEYDGHSWNRYLMPNKGIVRSVLADPDGKIYCGSSQEFGYFVKSGNSLIFRSLSDGLKEIYPDYNITEQHRFGHWHLPQKSLIAVSRPSRTSVFQERDFA